MVNNNEIDNDNEINVNVVVNNEDSISDSGDSGGGQDKVEICHNGETLEVAVPALPAHYGDTLGPCPETILVEPVPVEPVPVEPVPVEPVPVEPEPIES